MSLCRLQKIAPNSTAESFCSRKPFELLRVREKIVSTTYTDRRRLRMKVYAFLLLSLSFMAHPDHTNVINSMIDRRNELSGLIVSC